MRKKVLAALKRCQLCGVPFLHLCCPARNLVQLLEYVSHFDWAVGPKLTSWFWATSSAFLQAGPSWPALP